MHCLCVWASLCSVPVGQNAANAQMRGNNWRVADEQPTGVGCCPPETSRVPSLVKARHVTAAVCPSSSATPGMAAPSRRLRHRSYMLSTTHKAVEKRPAVIE